MKKILYLSLAFLLLLTACGKEEDQNKIDYTAVDEEVVEDTGSIQRAKDFMNYVVKNDEEEALAMCEENFHEDAKDMLAKYARMFSEHDDYKVEFTDFEEEFNRDRTTINFTIKEYYGEVFVVQNASLHFQQISDEEWLINGR